MIEEQISQAAALVGFADIKRDPIGGWEEFLCEGNQYLATAGGGYAKRRQVFTTEILYNIIGMGIEKLIMALLMRSGNLAYNHTMHDLVESMEEFLPGMLTEKQARGLRELDSYQEICDVDAFSITPPTMDEIAVMLVLAEELQGLATRELAD